MIDERLQKMLGERTFVLVKPDAVKRGLIGVIFQRFEQAGLKIVACKFVLATREILNGHFPSSDEWVRNMGEKTLETYREYGIDPIEILGTNEPFEIGLKIKEWNYHYLTIGPVVVMVLEGIHAVDTVRKIIGSTLPYKAAPGTIRGDFSINAPDLANVARSACKNLVHASGDQAEAKQEIPNWFGPTEILSWERTDEFLHFLQGEFTTTKKEKVVKKYEVLEQTLNSLKETNPRNAAEHAYALAVLCQRDGNAEDAARFGCEAISLFDKCQMNTAEDCAPLNVVIEGVAMPSSFIHQDVVRDRLYPLVP